MSFHAPGSVASEWPTAGMPDSAGGLVVTGGRGTQTPESATVPFRHGVPGSASVPPGALIRATYSVGENTALPAASWTPTCRV